MVDFVGNRTECALLVLLRKLGLDYEQVRVLLKKDTENEELLHRDSNGKEKDAGRAREGGHEEGSRPSGLLGAPARPQLPRLARSHL